MGSLVIRVDGNPVLGSGHIVRCVAIAEQAQATGCKVRFVVSDSASADLLHRYGYDALIVGGDASCLTAEDGVRLSTVCTGEPVDCVLVDSYAVNDSFFKVLKSELFDRSTKVAYIDDRYSLHDGILNSEVVWPVDVLIDYLFDAEQMHSESSCNSETGYLLGPSFAPVRHQFHEVLYDVREKAQNILITCGSTNQNRVLERIVSAVLTIAKDVEVNLVVGCQADYAGKLPNNIRVLRNVENMAALMQEADVAVSAAGTTLYELCSIGVPTVAIPIVENQIPNVKAFVAAGAGRGLTDLAWTFNDIAKQLAMLLSSAEKRRAYSSKMRQLVDGNGAVRILEAVMF